MDVTPINPMPATSHVFPIITIDGPSGAGKGTLTARLAAHFRFALLDSGALYRIVGLCAARQSLLEQDADEDTLANLTQSLTIEFLPYKSQKDITHISVMVNSEDVSEAIRTEEVGDFASKVAVFPKVRAALLALQHEMAHPESGNKGLIADGRDMGTVVFPEAQVKVFLIASAQARAERRVNQLLQAGRPADYDEILAQIVARDERDTNREAAPSKPANDAVVIDSSTMDADRVFKQVLMLCAEKGLK